MVPEFTVVVPPTVFPMGMTMGGIPTVPVEPAFLYISLNAHIMSRS